VRFDALVDKVDSLTGRFDSLGGLMEQLLGAMKTLAETSTGHEHRLRNLEGTT